MAGDWLPLREAGNALLRVCDGARSLDGQGYSRFDRGFAEDLLGKPSWSPRQARAFWKMLRKYRGQLDGMGLPFASLPEPPEVPSEPEPKPQQVPLDAAFYGDPRPVIKVAPRPAGSISLTKHPQYGFQFRCEFEPGEGLAVKDRFRAAIPVTIWEPESRTWIVPGKHAESLLAFAKEQGWAWSDEALAEATSRASSFRAAQEQRAAFVAASSAADSQFLADFRSKSGHALFPYQRAGAEYMVKKERCYLADEMGLGKTVQVMAALHHTQAFPALIACPASVSMVWERHVHEWLPGKKVAVAPASPAGADVYIGSYDRIAKAAERLKSVPWKAVICDEAHALKNRDAKRTQAFCGKMNRQAGTFEPGLLSLARFRWLLTGTPVPNRPSEMIQPLLGLDRLRDLGGFKGFATRYCGWVQGVPGTIDGSVPENLPELNQRLRASCWVRRLKEDVFKDLPDKRAAKAVQEFALGDAGTAEAIVQMTQLRRVAAEEKLAAAIEWVREFLEGGEKLVLLGWHNEPLQAIYNAFRSQAVLLTGSTSAQDRVRAIDAFQQSEDCRLFVGNLQAAGQGITLTAASNIAIYELPWTPAILDQGIARIHRIGQTASKVTIHYLLAAGTIDEDIAALIDQKRAVSVGIQDGKAVSEGDLVSALLGRLRSRVDDAEARFFGEEAWA
jgi:SWI/SNF-related matrix-associated actin-dependent regulator of chromatin subfamily A-like protein 1